ncbi:MAG: site-specific integrase [Oscillospiraceae bacterium]|nr:site-specific integrase [Oscillospiraceae bacterium]
MIAYYTGMRNGEINSLKWSDIEGDLINVRRSVSQKIKGVTVTEIPPKNKKSYRLLQMPLPLIKVLDEHRARYQAVGKYSDDLRICGWNQCLSDTSIENRNTRFAKEAGLPHIRIHDFRHSHASLLANEGINIQEIARHLGHSKIEQTWNTYAHLYPREEERAVQILNRVK